MGSSEQNPGRPVVAIDIDGTIAHSHDDIEIISFHSGVVDGGNYARIAEVKAPNSDKVIRAFDISNPRAGDKVFFDLRAKIALEMLGLESDLVITTSARQATMEARRHVFDFADWLSIEAGGVILDKNFQRDEDWWQYLDGKRKILAEFVPFLENKGLILDMDGRTSEIRIRKKDNPHLNNVEFQDLLCESFSDSSLSPELKRTANLGHADIVIATKAEALSYIITEKLNGVLKNSFAMGDDINDLELLQMAGKAWILGNGHPDLIDLAPQMRNAVVTNEKYFEGTLEAIAGIMTEIRNATSKSLL